MRQLVLTNSDVRAIVDDEDYYILARHTWLLTKHGYAKNASTDRYLHWFVMGYGPAGHVVDHISRDRLDCRKQNLRWVTHQNNSMNRPAQKNGGKFKGVYRRNNKLKHPWQASITKTVDGKKKTYHVGYFNTEREAALAYNVKAVELFGEFAFLNEI